MNKSIIDSSSEEISSKGTGNENRFKDFQGDTTLHGFKYVFNSQSDFIRRILWACILLGMFAAFGGTLVESLVKYYKYETYTSTNIKRVTQHNMPAITMCNMNTVSKTLLEATYPALVDSLQAFFLEAQGVEVPPNLTHAFSADHFAQLGNVTFMDFMSLTYPIEDIFLKCKLGNNNIPCADYLHPIHTKDGTCYTFHSHDFVKKNKSIKAYQAGSSYGVSFLIDVHPDDYILTSSLGHGIKIQINDPEVYPYLDTNTIVVSPGKETFISFHKTETYILGKPYTLEDCVKNEDLQEMSEKYNSSIAYSEQLCQDDCAQSYIFDCGCVARSTGPNACPVFQVFTCSRTSYYSFYNGEKHCDCPQRCQYTHYSHQISSSTFPNKNMIQVAKTLNWTQFDTFEEMNKRLAMVTVYFDSMTYTETRQLPVIELNQLLSNFGGQLGLFTGASIITIMEFLDFLIVSILHRTGMRNFRHKTTHMIKVKPHDNLY